MFKRGRSIKILPVRAKMMAARTKKTSIKKIFDKKFKNVFSKSSYIVLSPKGIIKINYFSVPLRTQKQCYVFLIRLKWKSHVFDLTGH